MSTGRRPELEPSQRPVVRGYLPGGVPALMRGAAPELRVPRPRRDSPVAGGAIAATLVVLSLAAPIGLAPAPVRAAPLTAIALFSSHVNHIVFLMQENHAFDNLYGTYCPALAKHCRAVADGIPPGTCVPRSPTNASAGCIAPFPLTKRQLVVPDMPHGWNSTHEAWDGGAMDGFYPAELNTSLTFGHYNGSTVPVYWDLAEEYGLADQFYSSAATFSLANHWYAVASAAPNASFYVKTENVHTSAASLFQYLNQSNATPAVEDRLQRSNVSWAYYDFPLPQYNNSTRPYSNAPAYDYWNPLAARAQSYLPKNHRHFEGRLQFFADARNGTLPNVSWIIPVPYASDHPPFSLATGQDWVAAVVDALETSPEWNTTALFISWDEYGGFYDHVAPPQPDAYGDGMRVPLLAVGPWVRQGVIDHQSMDFDSVLRLIEERFHLRCLGPRDCNATVPLAMFNFSSGPRAPIFIPPFLNASYPMPLQSSGLLPPYGVGFVPPPPPSAVEAAAAVILDWN